MNHLGPSLRRTRSRPWTGWRLLVGVLLSLAVNGLVFWLVSLDWSKLKAFPSEGPRSVSMAPVSASNWEANRRITDGSKPPPPPVALPQQRMAPPPRAQPQPQPQQPQQPVAETPAQPAPQQSAQVVDVAPTSTDKPPPTNTRFLAESNNTVEKETISRFRRLDYQKAAPTPTQNKVKPQAPGPKELQASRDPSPGTPGGDTRKAGAPGRLADSAPKPAPDKLAMAVSPDGRLEAKQPPQGEQKKTPFEELGEGGEGGEGAQRAGQSGGKPILTPSAAFYDKLTAAPAPDHVEGVDVGDATFLNTREWKYAGFFNRVKQAVAENWDPMGAARPRDPDGSKYFYKDRTTVVAVTLDARGGIRDIKVDRSSGLPFLDQTAIEAFEKAQPFVNPPPGLANSQGEIRFTFGFHIETGGGGFRFFRGQQ